MPLVADVMRPQPFTLPAEMLASEVARCIDREGVRHVLVVDEAGRLVDLLIEDLPMRELLVANVVTIGPSATAGEAVCAMRHHRIGSLPVVDETGVVVGLVSERMLLPFAEAVLCGTLRSEGVMG